MPNRQKIIFGSIIFVVAIAAFFVGKSQIISSSYTVQQTIEPTPAAKSVLSDSAAKQSFNQGLLLVSRIIDGDTIELANGKKVRYIGVDTPESVDPRKPIECFGIEATKENKKLVENKKVRLEKDISERDKYGRLLRYVYADNIFVNLELIKRGYAHSSSYPPDIKYQEEFKKAERYARQNKLGLWSGCPLDKTANPPPSVSSPASPNCPIKGNINSSGEKIYHLPAGEYYEKTQISENRGERWFCSEAEAQTAGWRKSKK